MKRKNISGCWMILHRHYAMPGGIFNHGTAEILNMVDSYKEAKKYVKRLHDENFFESQFSTVWILRCEQTHTKEWIANTNYKTQNKQIKRELNKK